MKVAAGCFRNYWRLLTAAMLDSDCTNSTLLLHMMVQIQIQWILLQVIQCTLYSTAGHMKQLSIFTTTEALIYNVPNNMPLKLILKVSDDAVLHLVLLAFWTSSSCNILNRTDRL